MKFTYEEVASYLEYHEVEKNKIYCEFKTPDGETVSSTAHIKKSNNLKEKVKNQVTRTITRQAKAQASRLIRRALGGGVLGRTGSTIVRGSINTRSNQSTRTHTQEAINQSIADAFRKVSKHFDVKPSRRSKNRKQKVNTANAPEVSEAPRASKYDLSFYDKRVNEFQRFANNFDKEILARMLVELANADGRITFEEEKFLEEIIPDGMGNVARFTAMETISRIEFQEVSNSVKEAIYTFAWVMALIDFDLHENEKGILMEYAEMFGFSAHKTESLLNEAKVFVLEGEINSYTEKTELFQLAEKLEMTQDKSERVLIQIKKRS